MRLLRLARLLHSPALLHKIRMAFYDRHCKFMDREDGEGVVCSQCGVVREFRVVRRCDSQVKHLGDLVEAAIYVCGLTPSGSCGCGKRKIVLNRWGKEWGKWLRSRFQDATEKKK